MAAPTLLDQLRTLSAVDCDTLDVEGEQSSGAKCSSHANQSLLTCHKSPGNWDRSWTALQIR